MPKVRSDPEVFSHFNAHFCLQRRRFKQNTEDNEHIKEEKTVNIILMKIFLGEKRAIACNESTVRDALVTIREHAQSELPMGTK